MWNSTVETVMNSREAMSAFVLPPAARMATCRSCGVRSLGAGTVRLRTCSPVAVSLTPEQFRYAFGNALSEEESDALYQRWTVPAPGRPLFEAAAANFNPHASTKVDTHNSSRGPLLLISGGKDHTVPESVVRATLAQYRHSEAVTDIIDFPDRGHSLTIDSGWPEVATTALDWLRRRSL